MEKKLRKYRAKASSPDIDSSKLREYEAKIAHYTAKAVAMGSPLPQRSASGGESAGADWAVGDRAHCGAHLGLGTVRFIGECLELGGTARQLKKCLGLLGNLLAHTRDLAERRRIAAKERALLQRRARGLLHARVVRKVRGQRYFGPTSPRKGVLVKINRLRPAA